MIAESLAVRAARHRRCNGFDALRLMLAAGIVAFHSYSLGHDVISGMAWQAQVAARLILPAFFIISGFLVAGSLERCAGLGEFLFLRALRILPALTVVVGATALVAGPLLSGLPARRYFADPAVAAYLQNILALPHFALPGVFEGNIRAGVVNGALWTIQLEFLCYLLLAGLALLARGRALTLLLAASALLLLSPLHLPLPARDLLACFAAGALLHRLARHVILHPLMALAALAAAFWLVTDPAHLSWAVLPLAYGTLWLGTRRLPEVLTRHDYSYGLYLTAYPLQQMLLSLHPWPWWQLLALSLPAAGALSALLWHGLERPLLARKHSLFALPGCPTTRAMVPQAATVSTTLPWTCSFSSAPSARAASASGKVA